MIFLNILSKEKCSARWDSNPHLSQSGQVPYHLDHQCHLFLGTLIQGLMQISFEDLDLCVTDMYNWLYLFIYSIVLYHLWCLGWASSVAVQETDPDGQAEPTLQTIQQEQSHESAKATEDETHSEQEEQPVQVPDVMPNIASFQRKEKRRR